MLNDFILVRDDAAATHLKNEGFPLIYAVESVVMPGIDVHIFPYCMEILDELSKFPRDTYYIPVEEDPAYGA